MKSDRNTFSVQSTHKQTGIKRATVCLFPVVCVRGMNGFINSERNARLSTKKMKNSPNKLTFRILFFKREVK